MKQPNEGYIKFHCHLTPTTEIIDRDLYFEINDSRNILYAKSLIGAYPNGIGYGNISIRRPNSSEFYITGTVTGGIDRLIPTQYVLVNNVNVATNTVYCTGSIEASSETMSHAVIYEANKAVNAVIHIHNKAMWDYYINKLPTTPSTCAYGTPQIAEAIKKIVLESSNNSGIIITGGHEEGVIIYGDTMEKATEIVLKHYDLMK